jgi:hypothetical protein
VRADEGRLVEVPVPDATGMDRRAWWMKYWLLGTRAIETPQVFEQSEPILLVANDDGLWQLIGTSDATEDYRVGHLYHAVDEDRTLLDVLDLEPGQSASRRPGGRWTRA